jgi:hypothetical protein
VACTEQARRVQRARRIIRRAYRLSPEKLPLASRFELIGGGVAALVTLGETAPPTIRILVAREYPSGYTRKLNDDSRDDLRSHRDVMVHFERLYSKYRDPQGAFGLRSAENRGSPRSVAKAGSRSS